MKKYFPLLAFLLAIVCSCDNSSIQADSWIRTTDTGISYGYSKIIINDSPNPTFVIGRNSKEDQTYKADWVSSGDGFFLSGFKLEESDSPSLYFSENGKIKKVTISRSGIWLPLFNESDPTTDELEVILNEAIQRMNKNG